MNTGKNLDEAHARIFDIAWAHLLKHLEGDEQDRKTRMLIRFYAGILLDTVEAKLAHTKRKEKEKYATARQST